MSRFGVLIGTSPTVRLDFSATQDQTTNEGPGFPGPLFLVPRRAKSTNGRFSRTWRRPSATTAAQCFTVSPIRDSSVQVVKKLRNQTTYQQYVKSIKRSDISHINPAPPPLPLIPVIVSQEFDHLGCPNICPGRMIDLTGRPKFRYSILVPEY